MEEPDGSIDFSSFAPYLSSCIARCPELAGLVSLEELARKNPRLTFEQSETLGDMSLTLESHQRGRMQQFITGLREAGLLKEE